MDDSIYKTDTIEPEDNIRIIGSFNVPTYSYGGGVLTYRGPISGLFFDVSGWNELSNQPVGKIPDVVKEKSGFTIQVMSGEKCTSIETVIITNVLAYEIGPGDYVVIKFKYRPINSYGIREIPGIGPVLSHIYHDPISGFIALFYEGEYKTVVKYIQSELSSFVHGNKTYYRHEMMKLAQRYDRSPEGEELYETVAVILIAHNSVPAPKDDDFKVSLERFIDTAYNIDPRWRLNHGLR